MLKIDKETRSALIGICVVLLFVFLLSFAASSEKKYAQYSNYPAATEQHGLFIGIGPEGWTAIFTGLLTLSTIGLWIVSANAAGRSETALKTVERAYLFADFRDCFIGDPEESLEFFFGFHNAGKTPALVYEVYGEISDRLPPIVSYPDPERIMVINRSVGGDKIERLGSVFAPIGGPVVFGYVKYRDIFKDSHVTGFAAVFNPERDQWETDAATAAGWNYWD